jgi:hypothetical protein
MYHTMLIIEYGDVFPRWLLSFLEDW